MPAVSKSAKAKRKIWAKKYNAIYHKKNYETIIKQQKGNQLLRRYGITIEQYNEIHIKQNGLCASCGNSETRINSKTKQIQRLSVDHDHKTGKIRGLLCNGCNNAIGYLNESPEKARILAQYLEFHQKRV